MSRALGMNMVGHISSVGNTVSASVGNQGLCVQSRHTTDCASADFWGCAGNVWHYRKIDLILTETNQTDCNHQKLMVAVCFNGASTHDYRLS
ncbi:hypothetical protein PP714_02600 [Lacticaseibacillus paracasei]|nr:hypothetical protein [Lacticaseibacillus paracasei]